MITTEDGHMLTTVGLDLGDKTIQARFLDHHGFLVDPGLALLTPFECVIQ